MRVFRGEFRCLYEERAAMIAELLPGAERWARIESIFHEARTLHGPALQSLLDHLCGADGPLRKDVEALLDADRESSAISCGTRKARPSMAGRRLGNYELDELAGVGGMGSVYVAHRCDGQFSRRVALKILGAHLRNEFFSERFATERRLLAELDHPNITRLLDSGVSADGDPYLVLEYVDGRPIDEHCDEHRLTVRERVRLFLQLCAAMEYAHTKRVIHRDIKPSNILVADSGDVKLLDLGAAKLLQVSDMAPTATRFRMMTPRYASPEQLRGEILTPATDTYSMGVLLYELVTGAWPYGNPESLVAGLERAVREVAPRLPQDVADEAAAERRRVSKAALIRETRGDLWRVIDKAIQSNPANRYASVADLGSDLERYCEGRKVLARPRRLVSRKLGQAIAYALVVAAAIPGIAVLAKLARQHAAPAIAVLPFENRSLDPNDRYFSSGVTDAIYEGLDRVRPLLVISKSSSAQFRGDRSNLREVGRTLHASYLVEGSAAREGDRLNVIARLERTSDGAKIWERSYDRAASELYKLQTDISRDVALSLNGSVAPGPQKHLVTNQESIALVMKARVESNTLTEESYAQADADLRRAIALDPEYAVAWATLGMTVTTRWSRVARARGREDRGYQQEGQSYYRKALELDPSMVLPRVNLANFALQETWNWQYAESEYCAALSYGPNAAASASYGFMLAAEGRFREADKQFAAAMEQDPTSTVQMVNIGIARSMERRFADALQFAEIVDAKAPNPHNPHTGVDVYHSVLGDPQIALADYDRYPEKSPVRNLYRAIALARAGRKEEAYVLIRPMEADYQKNMPAGSFASFYAILGDRRAFDWIRRAVDDRDFQVLLLGQHPIFDPIRKTPEFQAILRQVGLVK